jgi:hypothetical protein
MQDRKRGGMIFTLRKEKKKREEKKTNDYKRKKKNNNIRFVFTERLLSLFFSIKGFILRFLHCLLWKRVCLSKKNNRHGICELKNFYVFF